MTVSSETPSLFYLKPQIFIRDPNIFIGHSQILIGDPQFFVGDHKLFIEDPNLYIGNPNIFIGDPKILVFWTPDFIWNPHISVETSNFCFKPPIFIGDLGGSVVYLWKFGVKTKSFGSPMNILGFLAKNLGSQKESSEYPIKIRGFSTKILCLRWKAWGLQ